MRFFEVLLCAPPTRSSFYVYMGLTEVCPALVTISTRLPEAGRPLPPIQLKNSSAKNSMLVHVEWSASELKILLKMIMLLEKSMSTLRNPRYEMIMFLDWIISLTRWLVAKSVYANMFRFSPFTPSVFPSVCSLFCLFGCSASVLWKPWNWMRTMSTAPATSIINTNRLARLISTSFPPWRQKVNSHFFPFVFTFHSLSSPLFNLSFLSPFIFLFLLVFFSSMRCPFFFVWRSFL